MVILDEGFLRTRDLVNADITHAQAGQGTTTASQSDTGLETASADTLNTTTNTTGSSPASLNIAHTVTDAEAIGDDLSEWEVRMNSSTESFNRTVTAPLAKTSTQEAQKTTTVEFSQ